MRVHYVNGQETYRTEVQSWLEREPEDRETHYGTQIVERTLSTPEAGEITYWRVVRMLATSYNAATAGTPPWASWYGYTVLGWRAAKGIVAVDPDVIPLGTQVYVPGYGKATAADTGSAIVDRHIDLCYDDDNLVMWYRWVNVYLLTPVPLSKQHYLADTQQPDREGIIVLLDPRAVLRRYGIRPSKGLGQNFLIQGSIMERTVEASDISSDDVVLEVGPGVGVLTRLLAERARHVVAVELDDRLIPVLESELGSCENVTIVHNDILAINPAEIVPMDEGLHYKVVANLPYYITSAVLRHLLEAELVPEQLTVMVQREVAQRIVAVPGNMSLLALSVQVYGKPRLALHVPAAAFYPAPKVDSAVLVIARLIRSRWFLSMSASAFSKWQELVLAKSASSCTMLWLATSRVMTRLLGKPYRLLDCLQRFVRKNSISPSGWRWQQNYTHWAVVSGLLFLRGVDFCSTW